MEKSKNKVLLGLSGGVDSTTAALLLKEKGLEVTGYYFDIAGTNLKGQEEAKEVANQLNIPLIIEDISELFKDEVINNFFDEYTNGRTPNPCIVCNPKVKFKKLLENADKIGAYYIATGHYAQVEYSPKEDIYFLKKAANEKKDQSYMLYRLGQDVLSRLIFPLGSSQSKDDVRALAKDSNLSNWEKKDSQEICFVPDDDYVSYLKNMGAATKEGDIVDLEGNVLGKHKGIINYTIGQRKGLGVALGKPAFVLKIDAAKNQIVLGDNEYLFSDKITSKDNIFTISPQQLTEKNLFAKVRYAAKPAEAKIQILDDGTMITTFSEKQRASTPGQSIVIYDKDLVVGGGFII